MYKSVSDRIYKFENGKELRKDTVSFPGGGGEESTGPS